MSINRGMDKEDVVHIYDGISVIKRNEIGSFVVMWRNLESVIQSEASQKEKNNRMGKTRDLFKEIRDTKGTFLAKMGSIKDRNGMDLTEA